MILYIDKFEESKENKLEYTEVFNNYTKLVERSIEQYLSDKIPVSKECTACFLVYKPYTSNLLSLVNDSCIFVCRASI